MTCISPTTPIDHARGPVCELKVMCKRLRRHCPQPEGESCENQVMVPLFHDILLPPYGIEGRCPIRPLHLHIGSSRHLYLSRARWSLVELLGWKNCSASRPCSRPRRSRRKQDASLPAGSLGEEDEAYGTRRRKKFKLRRYRRRAWISARCPNCYTSRTFGSDSHEAGGVDARLCSLPCPLS